MNPIATEIDQLNEQFAIANHCEFAEGKGGMVKAVIRNDFATAEIYLHGAHLTSYQPTDGHEVLWMSDQAEFQPGKAIRGGIPICWPWFGPHPTDEDKPSHGLARTLSWDIIETVQLADSTRIALGLASDEATRELWPHDFELTYTVWGGQALRVALTACNVSDENCELGAALHTYFRVPDIHQVRLVGLEDAEYVDKLDGNQRRFQEGPVIVGQEVDRVYLGEPPMMTIEHADSDRRVNIQSKGSASTVVWNPWTEKATRMEDFPNDGFLRMICVETANALDDVRIVKPGYDHTLSQLITA